MEEGGMERTRRSCALSVSLPAFAANVTPWMCLRGLGWVFQRGGLDLFPIMRRDSRDCGWDLTADVGPQLGVHSLLLLGRALGGCGAQPAVLGAG